MKTTVLAALISTALIGVSPAPAQVSNLVVANVPFDFSVGKTVLPAGHYEIKLDLHPHVVALLRADRSAGVTVTTTDGLRKDPDLHGFLRFQHHGDQYVLTGVFAPGRERARLVSPSKAAREMMAAGARPETIEIAALYVPNRWR